MTVGLWIFWGVLALGYVGVLGLTSGCEKRFIADPHRRVPGCTEVRIAIRSCPAEAPALGAIAPAVARPRLVPMTEVLQRVDS